MMRTEEYLSYIAEQSLTASQWFGENKFNEKGVFVSRVWMHILDGNAYHAIVFSQIMYWFGLDNKKSKTRLTHEHQNHLWFVTTYEELAEQTGIKSHKTIRNAINKLQAQGLILKEQHYSPFHRNENGGPKSVSFIRPDWEGIVSAYEEWEQIQMTASPLEGDTETPDEATATQVPQEGDAFTQIIHQENKKNSSLHAFKFEIIGKLYARNTDGLQEDGFAPTYIDNLPDEADAFIYLMENVTRTNWATYNDSIRHRILEKRYRQHNEENPEQPVVYKHSLNFKYNNEPPYRAWVDEVIVPKLLENSNKVSKEKFLHTVSNYLKYQDWLKTPEGQESAERAIRNAEDTQNFLNSLWN